MNYADDIGLTDYKWIISGLLGNNGITSNLLNCFVLQVENFLLDWFKRIILDYQNIPPYEWIIPNTVITMKIGITEFHCITRIALYYSDCTEISGLHWITELQVDCTWIKPK